MPSAIGTLSSILGAFSNPWPHTIGPVMVYMASCGGSCTDATTSDLEWVSTVRRRHHCFCTADTAYCSQFKIDEAGLISGDLPTGLWGMGELVNDNSSWTTTIPASLAPGEYFIRHEVCKSRESFLDSTAYSL